MDKIVLFNEAYCKNGICEARPILINLREVDAVYMSDDNVHTMISMKSGNCFKLKEKLEDVFRKMELEGLA